MGENSGVVGRLSKELANVPTDVDAKATLENLERIRKLERDKQHAKRKMATLPPRELKAFKREEKAKAKNRPEIPQEAIDTYNKIVKK